MGPKVFTLHFYSSHLTLIKIALRPRYINPCGSLPEAKGYLVCLDEMWGSVTAHQHLMRWGWEQAGRTLLLQHRNGCLQMSSWIVPKPLCVHISVFPSLQRTEQLALSGVGWDLISDAAQPVISAIITSLIQPLLSASPSSLLPSCFPFFLLFPASLCFQTLTSHIHLFYLFLHLLPPLFACLPFFSFPSPAHLCPSPMWIWSQMSEFFSLVVHWANVPGGRPSDLSSEQLCKAPRGSMS